MTDLPDLSTLEVGGPFRLEVISIRSGAPPQQITITGSDGSDGNHTPVVGMKIDISGKSWRCGLLWQDKDDGSWNKCYWLIVDYTAQITSGLVIQVEGQNDPLIIGFPTPRIDIQWTLTSTDPATVLPPIRGSAPGFSFDEHVEVVVGLPAAENAAGQSILDLEH